jgi:hypothetical protein
MSEIAFHAPSTLRYTVTGRWIGHGHVVGAFRKRGLTALRHLDPRLFELYRSEGSFSISVKLFWMAALP